MHTVTHILLIFWKGKDTLGEPCCRKDKQISIFGNSGIKLIKIQYRKSLIVIYEKVGELNVAEVQNCNLMAFSGSTSSLNCILPCFKNMNPLTSMPRIFMSLFPIYPDL
jgi:hypothetical protein